MTGQRRGRTGRGWDAAPPRAATPPRAGDDSGSAAGDESGSAAGSGRRTRRAAAQDNPWQGNPWTDGTAQVGTGEEAPWSDGQPPERAESRTGRAAGESPRTGRVAAESPRPGRAAESQRPDRVDALAGDPDTGPGLPWESADERGERANPSRRESTAPSGGGPRTLPWQSADPHSEQPTATGRRGRQGRPASGTGRPGTAGRRGRPTDEDRPAAESKPADPAERAREICLRLLSFRPRTRSELATALSQRGIADEVSAEVLDRYSEVGMIDDEAFARAWVTSRHHGRGLARKALAGELRRKGVESEAVGAALDELDPAIELQTARALVERKLRSDRGVPSQTLFRRLVGLLARKGYPAGLAFKVVKEVLEEHADAAALEAAELDAAELDPDVLDAEERAARPD
jgi:regulatory protein